MIEENPASVFLALINKAARQQRRDGNWRHDSRFARARSQLQSDSRGQVGEEFVAAGHSIAAIAALIDRQAGGKESLQKKYNAPVFSLFTKTDFGELGR